MAEDKAIVVVEDDKAGRCVGGRQSYNRPPSQRSSWLGSTDLFEMNRLAGVSEVVHMERSQAPLFIPPSNSSLEITSSCHPKLENPRVFFPSTSCHTRSARFLQLIPRDTCKALVLWYVKIMYRTGLIYKFKTKNKVKEPSTSYMGP